LSLVKILQSNIIELLEDFSTANITMKSDSKATKSSNFFNHHVVPPVFLIVFTIAAQVLTHVGNPNRPFQWWFLVGDLFSWTCVFLLVAWAFFWLWVPSKVFEGPTTYFNLTPVYQVNTKVSNGKPYVQIQISVFSFL